MGIRRIDFGSVEVKERSKSKALVGSDKSGWEGEALSFAVKTAKTGNVGIEVTYKVTDEDAKDLDGAKYTGKVWDTMWLSEKSLKITKLKLSGLGVDVSSLIIEDDEDLRGLVEDLNADFKGQPVRLVTELEEDNNGKEYDDGTLKQYTRVKFVNQLN